MHECMIIKYRIRTLQISVISHFFSVKPLSGLSSVAVSRCQADSAQECGDNGGHVYITCFTNAKS